MQRILIFILIIIGLINCDKNSTNDNPIAKNLKQNFRLVGEASNTENGFIIQGGFDFKVQLNVDPNESLSFYKEYRGKASGEASRSVTRPDGSGIGLLPLMYFQDIKVKVYANTITFILDSATAAESKSPYYKNISILKGNRKPNNPAKGSWICAPFNINQGGWVDTSGIALGTWAVIEE